MDDGVEKTLTVTDGQTEFAQIGFVQRTNYIEVDVVVGKDCGVTLQPDLG